MSSLRLTLPAVRAAAPRAAGRSAQRNFSLNFARRAEAVAAETVPQAGAKARPAPRRWGLGIGESGLELASCQERRRGPLAAAMCSHPHI